MSNSNMILADGAREQPNASSSAEHEVKVEFTGCARDYFRIWMVGVCLSLLTLGVYSAWAKVRNSQYLYAHTRLDGTPCEYRADPVVVLKGRAFAGALLGAWYVCGALSLWLQAACLGLGFLLAPWLFVSASRFAAQASYYRNVNGRFTGSYRGAARVLLRAALLTLTLVGIPWAYGSIRRYWAMNFVYGGVRARVQCSGGELLLPFALSWAVLVACLGVGVQGALFVYERPRDLQFALIVCGVLLVLGYLLSQSVRRALVTSRVWRSTELGTLRFRCELRWRELFWLYLGNSCAVVLSAGLMIPWAKVRWCRYVASRFQVLAAPGSYREFRGDAVAPVKAAGSEAAQALGLELGW